MVPAVKQRHLTLQPFFYDPQQQQGLMLTIHRLGDLRPVMRKVPPGAKLIAETTHRGVVLARLFDTSEVTWSDFPNWPGHKDD